MTQHLNTNYRKISTMRPLDYSMLETARQLVHLFPLSKIYSPAQREDSIVYIYEHLTRTA